MARIKKWSRIADDSANTEDEPMPDPDPVLLASANRMLSARLAGVAHVMRGCGLPALANIDDGEDLQMHAAALAGAYQMASKALVACESALGCANTALNGIADRLGLEPGCVASDMLDAIDRLSSQESAAVPEWQPIETAPKGGKKIILTYINRLGNKRTVMARWLTEEQVAETDTDDVGLEEGWYECIDNWDDYTEVAIREGEPIHWMPLPAAPSPAEKEKPHD